MSEQLNDQQNEGTVTRGYVSERGPFTINENPEITTPIPSTKIKEEHAARLFDS